MEVVFRPLSMRQVTTTEETANSRVLPASDERIKPLPLSEHKTSASPPGAANPRQTTVPRRSGEKRPEATPRRPSSTTRHSAPTRGALDNRRGSSAANLRDREAESTPHSARSERVERRRTSPTGVTRASSATGRLSGSRREANKVEVDPASHMRQLEAQLASFRTRNAALEGEVAQLRAEAQAVQQAHEEQLRRLRQELENKELQLQQKEQDLKMLQNEQNKNLQSFLRRAIPLQSGSLSLPAGAKLVPEPKQGLAWSPARSATPCVTHQAPCVPQIYSPQSQLRRVGEAPVLSFTNGSPHVAVMPMPVRMTPRQVWTYTPSHNEQDLAQKGKMS